MLLESLFDKEAMKKSLIQMLTDNAYLLVQIRTDISSYVV